MIELDDTCLEEVAVGDVVTLTARTEPLFLPEIFYPSAQEQAQAWATDVQKTFRANQVQNTVISLVVQEMPDAHREVTLELQATYVGDLPYQGNPDGFYGYDEDGNLLTEQQFVDRALMAGIPHGGFAASSGGAPSWNLVILAAAVIVGSVAFELTTAHVDHMATTPRAPGSPQSPAENISHDIADSIKTGAIAAAVIAVAYLLSKA